MHSRVWLAYAIKFLPALSASILRARLDTESQTTVSLTTISPGNVSTPQTEASGLSDGPYLELPISDNAIQQPSNYSSLYDVSFGNNSKASYSARPMCNGPTFGFNLDRYSCFRAWQSAGLWPERATWGRRGQGHNYKYNLPVRFSGSDGQCVIDVVFSGSSERSFDYASLLQISNAAEEVMVKCIDTPNEATRGGVLGKVGEHGDLLVVVRKYTPNVKCGHAFDKEEDPLLCADVLNNIPASPIDVNFGRARLGDTPWYLPWSYRATGSRCEFLLKMTPSAKRETMRWFDIWAATVAADAMCIKRGMIGTAPALGFGKQGMATLKVHDKPLTSLALARSVSSP